MPIRRWNDRIQNYYDQRIFKDGRGTGHCSSNWVCKIKEVDLVEEDLKKVVQATHKNRRLIKIIVEDAYTTLDEKKDLYRIVMQSGADFIKTGTEFEDK
jgi:deoxyribose-phosphate aldolase